MRYREKSAAQCSLGGSTIMTDIYSEYLQKLEELTNEEIEKLALVISKEFLFMKPFPKISKKSSLDTRKAKLIYYIFDYFCSVGRVFRDSHFNQALKKIKQ